MANHEKTLELIRKAISSCKDLSQNSDWYDSFERKETV